MAESMIDKINKLLRKAESCEPAEAELFFAKASELMAKYQIDEAMLEASKPQARGGVVHEEFVSVSIWRFPISELKWRTAMAMNLKVIQKWSEWREVGGKLYKQTEIHDVFGFQSDLDHFKLIITSLEIQMMRAENTWWDQNATHYSHESPSAQHRARRGFMFAFAQGAAAKVTEAGKKARQTADEQYGGESVALVLRDKSLEIADAFKAAYPLTKKSKDRKGRGDGWAQAEGYKAGRNADIGQSGVEKGSTKGISR